MPAGLIRSRPGGVEAAGPFANLVIDLDDTLLVEVESALFAFRAAAAGLRALHPGIDAEDFIASARKA